MPVIISSAQTRHKDSYAPASDLGLLLRSNGEETVKVIDTYGNVVLAGFEPPSVAPIPNSAGAGALTANKWVAYTYVYAAARRYPFVFSDVTAGGSDAPRGNPGSAKAFYIGSSSNQSVNVRVAYTTREDISDVWLYRTLFYDTQGEAELAAQAGLSYYINSATNNTAGGTVTINDNVLTPVERVELDNYIAPQFSFCTYAQGYFWGFGNYTFNALATYNNSGVGSKGLVTLYNGDTWFDGRNGQTLTIDGVSSGGFDEQGAYHFQYLSPTTANVYADSTNTLVTFPSSGSSSVTVQGPATTLYRSKLNNPFAWGYTEVIGTSFLPIQFGERVGGGYGSAISTVPNEELLVVCTRYPSRTYSLSLGVANDPSVFFASQRLVSDIYAFTSHFSVFAARVGQANVLRGIDYESLEIIQCDGVRAYPVMQEVSPLLREMTNNRARQDLAHGAYDPRSQTNCLWLTQSTSPALVNYGIFEDTKTGAITVRDEHDLLASGVISDTSTNSKVTLGGTQSGIYGVILDPTTFSDWTDGLSGLVSGVVGSSTNDAITRAGSVDFEPLEDGYIGNWCYFADATGLGKEWARIALASESGLTFDVFTGSAANQFAENPLPGSKFYVGLIECRMKKYFDFGAPSTGKKYLEQWLTMINSTDTTVQYYRERDTEPFKIMYPVQEFYSDSAEGKNTWSIKTTPDQQTKTWGIEIIDRGYDQFTFYNTVLKIEPNS